MNMKLSEKFQHQKANIFLNEKVNLHYLQFDLNAKFSYCISVV